MQNDPEDSDEAFINYFEETINECALETYKKGYSYEEIFWLNEAEEKDSHLKPLHIEPSEPYDYQKYDSEADEVVLNIEKLLKLIAFIALVAVTLVPTVKWITQLSGENPYLLSEAEIARIIGVLAFFLGVNAKTFIVFVLDFTDSFYLSCSLYSYKKRVKKIKKGGKHRRNSARRKKAVKVYPPFPD